MPQGELSAGTTDYDDAGGAGPVVALVHGLLLATVTTLTLMPQTVNGTVMVVSANNSFTVYTVALAPYDLIPTLQGYVGPITRLSNPSIITVYVDANTPLLNSTPIAPGSILRFRGLIFDDNGTLRMDCAQVNDGVTE